MSAAVLSGAVLAQSGSNTIPSDTGGPYVVAAYVVFLTLIGVYVAIMAQRLAKVSRAADELQARLDAVQPSGAGAVQNGAAASAAASAVVPSTGAEAVAAAAAARGDAAPAGSPST